MTITTLIINELKDILGHTPSQKELNSLSEYLATRNIRYLVELEIEIEINWKNLYTKECAWCGDRFLEEEMIQTAVNQHFCCDQCKKDYEEEHKVGKCTIE